MDEYLAHSAKGDFPPQTYKDHISNVLSGAEKYAREAGSYSVCGGELLHAVVKDAALFHDLGKLADENQAVLHSTGDVQRHLPTDHTDAGSAFLKPKNIFDALLVFSHHRGLPDMEDEHERGYDLMLRNDNQRVRDRIDSDLNELLRRHTEIFPDSNVREISPYEGDQPVFFRMALSCLADADHTDTAAAYGQLPDEGNVPSLLPKKRLEALDKYVSALPSSGERGRLRQEMYISCRDAYINNGDDVRFSACDSPVGSGKTTAVMAHLLRQAAKRNSRRIFVILPYTSIISQSVKIYRQALALPGEDPEKVVAEMHHRADFENESTRYLTALWRAPIVVTTAVAFFETLASNRPASLRRLHELPGSVFFIDEAHGALPLKLLPLAWHWMNVLAFEWSCYFVLASGSLVKFWELEQFSEFNIPRPPVGELVAGDLRGRLMSYESERVSFRYAPDPLDRTELIKLVTSAPGPRLLIMNTVQSAAVIADDICAAYGRDKVEHLSTALTSEDRNAAIDRIKARLFDKDDNDWTLVATSCVEAGVDFSFETGFREMSSLLSLLQAAGRVNRHGSSKDAVMWSFTMKDDSMLKKNAAFDDAKKILKRYFEHGITISPELSTRSMNDELIINDSSIKTIKHTLDLEDAMQFREVNDEFHVIDSDSVTAIVDEALAESVRHGGGDPRSLQKNSVSVRRDKIRSWSLCEIAPGVYKWTLGYDSFLGYMRGVLEAENSKKGILIF